VHVLLATDAQWVVDDVVAALSGPDTSFTVCRNGRDVTDVVKARTPDIAVLDMQSGSMGGMAVTMNLRLDESSGAVPHIPVLMLLDRVADVFMARRSGADDWLIKPLNPLALQRAVHQILNPPAQPVVEASTDTAPEAPDEAVADAETAEEEPATAG
jgi:DNA-binding response OmpR family regulator